MCDQRCSQVIQIWIRLDQLWIRLDQLGIDAIIDAVRDAVSGGQCSDSNDCTRLALDWQWTGIGFGWSAVAFDSTSLKRTLEIREVLDNQWKARMDSDSD